MRAVVTSGTGRAAAKSRVPVAGKTGTAELARGAAHAWFAGFAPAAGPAEDRVAFAIVVANGGYGGAAAAPFAADIAELAREAMAGQPRLNAEVEP
jgi:peptidoglycan glycosyltransferase